MVMTKEEWLRYKMDAGLRIVGETIELKRKAMASGNIIDLIMFTPAFCAKQVEMQNIMSMGYRDYLRQEKLRLIKDLRALVELRNEARTFKGQITHIRIDCNPFNNRKNMEELIDELNKDKT